MSICILTCIHIQLYIYTHIHMYVYKNMNMTPPLHSHFNVIRSLFTKWVVTLARYLGEIDGITMITSGVLIGIPGHGGTPNLDES